MWSKKYTLYLIPFFITNPLFLLVKRKNSFFFYFPLKSEITRSQRVFTEYRGLERSDIFDLNKWLLYSCIIHHYKYVRYSLKYDLWPKGFCSEILVVDINLIRYSTPCWLRALLWYCLLKFDQFFSRSSIFRIACNLGVFNLPHQVSMSTRRHFK